MIRRLMVTLSLAVSAAQAGPVFAQGASSASALQAGASDECMKQYAPLREEAEQRRKLIIVASDQHAPAVEACKLIGNFSQAELKLIKYVEGRAAQCGTAPQISDQLNSDHKNTENLLQKVCAVARQMPQRGPSGPTGDF
jgi:hypothetical protein